MVTLAASFLWLAPLMVPTVAGDAVATALYVSNRRFGVNATGYFAAVQAPSPTPHFWSLGCCYNHVLRLDRE